MSMREPRIVLIAGVWLAAAAAANAAAEPTSQAGGLEEVIVTAQKRSESEQSVPMSMTTFSSAALEQKSITSFFDYATKVPNLAFAPTGDGVGTARAVSIRGISGQNVTGFYIDDVILPDSLDPRVLDIDHIEVLRGPQGTLYGARSMGGTVRLITKDPDMERFSATLHGGVSNTDRTDSPNYTADGILNTPLGADWIALRLTGFYDDQAGYFKRSWCTDPATALVTCLPLSTTGRTTVGNVADLNTYGGSASLTIKVNDSLTITPRAMLQRADYNGLPLGDFNSLPGDIGFPAPSGPYNLPQPLRTTDFTQARFFDVPEGGSDFWGLYSLTLHWKTGVGEFVSSTAYSTARSTSTRTSPSSSGPRSLRGAATRQMDRGRQRGPLTAIPRSLARSRRSRTTSASSRRRASPRSSKARSSSWSGRSSPTFTAACRSPRCTRPPRCPGSMPSSPVARPTTPTVSRTWCSPRTSIPT